MKDELDDDHEFSPKKLDVGIQNSPQEAKSVQDEAGCFDFSRGVARCRDAKYDFHEWQSNIENGIQYDFGILDFETKMRRGPPGEEICSKQFKIGASSFKLCIYPAGVDALHKNYVSVYLMNLSKIGKNFSLNATL